ncbi:MAG: hypothetical protein QOF58_5098 [Pseudonocardiales bacterium]|jgi:hypothetical protein|nr:hypothetical protein [Pseudonocardiales bacterium]
MTAPTAPRGRGDRGAVAVEFALVVPILVAILLAIIDFGLWFSDSIGVRQGAREGARVGIVSDFAAENCPQLGPGPKTACVTKDRIGAVGGQPWVRVFVAGDKPWVEGNTLVVCVALQESGLTGFTPMPQGGVLRTITKSRIQMDNPSGPTAASDTVPAEVGWDWCA